MSDGLPPAPARVRRTPRSEVRERLINAAANVFAARGFAAATIEEIARQAGFSKGAVYSNFGSKDDLFFALLDRQVVDRIGVAERAAAAASGAGSAAVAERSAHELAIGLNDDPSWTAVLLGFWADAVRDAERRERLDEHRAPLRAAVAQLIDEECRRTGASLRLSAQDAATAVIALVNGIAVERLAHPGTTGSDLLKRVLPLLFAAAEPRQQSGNRRSPEAAVRKRCDM